MGVWTCSSSGIKKNYMYARLFTLLTYMLLCFARTFYTVAFQPVSQTQTFYMVWLRRILLLCVCGEPYNNRTQNPYNEMFFSEDQPIALIFTFLFGVYNLSGTSHEVGVKTVEPGSGRVVVRPRGSPVVCWGTAVWERGPEAAGGGSSEGVHSPPGGVKIKFYYLL